MTKLHLTDQDRRNRTHAAYEVKKALRSGRLVRQPCQECGATDFLGKIVEGHHYLGYDPEHALDIRWLCASHHIAEHSRMRLEASREAAKAA